MLVVILNVSLVKHGATDWTWTVVLWPVFAGLCVCFIIMVGIVLFTLGSFLSWVSEEIGTKEFISTVWLLLTLTGSTSSILVLCLHVTRPGYLSLKENYCVYPISFLFFFLISTYLNINNLVDWWTMFFSQNNPENSDIQPIHVNPPPNLSLPQRITQVVKRAPHALMRISSSYFQPIETPKNHKLKKRTLSLKSNIEDDIIAHRRIFSNPMKLEVLSPKAEPEKFEEKIKSGLCSMCYENLPNAVIMECGHGGICYDCSLQLWKTGGHCHMCRGEISQVLQIEIGLSSMVKVSSTTRAVYYDNE